VSIRPTLFHGQFLDRRAELRDDPQWVIAALRPGNPLRAGHWRRPAGDRRRQPRIAFLAGGHPLVTTARDDDLTLLGWFRGARCVLVGSCANRAAVPDLPTGTELRELRPLAAPLPPDSASLLSHMRARWACGRRVIDFAAPAAPNLRRAPARVMRCSREGCGSGTFPRLDPAIIVLVTDPSGRSALLGRQASCHRRALLDHRRLHPSPARASRTRWFARWPRKPACRSEVGARLVAAVAIPVVADAVFAVASTDAITLRDGELEDARWFTRADVAAGHPALPPAGAISARLIDAWYSQPGGPPRRW
jgi:NAD+ diphosphatase